MPRHGDNDESSLARIALRLFTNPGPWDQPSKGEPEPACASPSNVREEPHEPLPRRARKRPVD